LSAVALARRRRQGAAEAEEGYFVSMTDMMVGLVFVLIVMLVYFAMQFHRTTVELTDSKTRRTELLHRLQARLHAQNLDVGVDADAGVLRLPEAVLFAKGSAEVTPAGQAALPRWARRCRRSYPAIPSKAPCPLHVRRPRRGWNRC
jgi:chemotaxis protein MotB